MTLPRPITLICPNCQNAIDTDALMSTNYYGLTTDLHRLTSGANPLTFLIHSCQSCGFTGGESEFQGAVDPNVAAQIQDFIYPHIHDEQLSADSRWEFAAKISEWRQQHPEKVAQLYLNAAWCSTDSDKEHYYRRRAADWLEQAIDIGVKNRLTITYLIGELYRRVGEIDISHYWFDVAIAEAKNDIDENATRIKELAIQQKTNPQDMITN